MSDGDIVDERQWSLFPMGRARRTDPITSHLAAEKVGEWAATQRSMILGYLAQAGEATGDQLDEVFGWDHATANRRLPELRDDGLVTMTLATAKTRKGRLAHLWRLTNV